MTTSPEALREAVERVEALSAREGSSWVYIALSDLRALLSERKALRAVYMAARDVSLASTQDDTGRWIITGDAEVMLGDLYLATEVS